MAHPAACLFDLDGLLLDTEPLHADAWQRAAQHFGRELTDGELMQLRGRRRLDCADQVRLWIGAGGLEVPSPEALLAIRQPIAEALLIQAQPMAGAEALVQRCLDLALPMALATSSSREAVLLKARLARDLVKNRARRQAERTLHRAQVQEKASARRRPTSAPTDAGEQWARLRR